MVEGQGPGAEVRRALEYYYLGYYIHSCTKMKYKGDFQPCNCSVRSPSNGLPRRPHPLLLDQSPYAALLPTEASGKSSPKAGPGQQDSMPPTDEEGPRRPLGVLQMKDLISGAGLQLAGPLERHELEGLAARALRILRGEEEVSEQSEEEGARPWIVPKEKVNSIALGLRLHIGGALSSLRGNSRRRVDGM